MNFREILLAAFCVAGPVITPAAAQLVHVSVDSPDALLLFKANRADIPWNQSGGFVRQLDFTYNSQEEIGALDPGRNYWRMRVENPELGRSFTLTRPFHNVLAWEQGLVFEYFVSTSSLYEMMELTLVFDEVISPEGRLPQPPLPALGATEYVQPRFRFHSGNSMFGVPYLAEAYGGGGISSISTTMTPIPEPSAFAFAGLALIGWAIGMRQRGKPRCV